MHIVIGFLGSLVTILYLLDRLGIDIGGLNPFYWYRRRAYAKKYGADPIYSLEDPIHIASLLIIGTAKLGGDLTAEQKHVAQGQFESSFSMSPDEASGLFGSAAHLLAAPQLLEGQLQKLVDRNASRLSRDQTESMMQMMTVVASAGGGPSPTQRDFIENIRSRLVPTESPKGVWS